ncbi:hypothetical protein ACIBCM_21390 [Streptomyces sp. NPDC051018]|uniref:hypothetical protein n=1 Tax=Streptomyces sp. NPDC051018 TaxID=3365639 RepID=UPI0037AA6A6B
MTDKGARILLALALATAVLTGCGEPSPDTSTRTAAAPGGGGGTKDGPAAPAAREIPFELYTHCGIEGAQIGSTYFVARTPLSDGSGNPPEGWDNPHQKGTMTVLSPTEAVFTDQAGHRVEFHVRPGVKGPENICR